MISLALEVDQTAGNNRQEMMRDVQMLAVSKAAM
jgi:hypothetical protein